MDSGRLTDVPKEKEEIVPGMSEAIEARRVELGLTIGQFQEAANLSGPGLGPVRKGYRRRYQDSLKFGVAKALRWENDAIDRLLRGEAPVPLPDSASADTIAEVERTLRTVPSSNLVETLEEIRDLVNAMLGEATSETPTRRPHA